MNGTIKRFFSDKGFGFIKRDEDCDDLFFHISQVRNARRVDSGDRVSFEIGKGRKGPAATNVRILSQ